MILLLFQTVQLLHLSRRPGSFPTTEPLFSPQSCWTSLTPQLTAWKELLFLDKIWTPPRQETSACSAPCAWTAWRLSRGQGGGWCQLCVVISFAADACLPVSRLVAPVLLAGEYCQTGIITRFMFENLHSSIEYVNTCVTESQVLLRGQIETILNLIECCLTSQSWPQPSIFISLL